MKRNYLFIVLLVVLLALQMAPANATGAMTVTIESTSLSLSNHLLVNVPVKVVCDPLPGTIFNYSASVYLQQAKGNKINRGSGSMSLSSGMPPFICDGTTANYVTVQLTPDSNSEPFHGGPAIASASAGYLVFDEFGNMQNESGSSGPIAVHLH